MGTLLITPYYTKQMVDRFSLKTLLEPITGLSHNQTHSKANCLDLIHLEDMLVAIAWHWELLKGKQTVHT